MYNGKVIKELLDSKNIPYGDLLKALGMNPKQTSVNSLVKGNPSAKRLESIADFFGVSSTHYSLGKVSNCLPRMS